MRKVIGISGLVLLFLFISSTRPVPSAISQSISQPPPPSQVTQVLGDARLSMTEGDVVIQTKDSGDEWGAATINTPLMPGARLWDPEEGRSEIQFFGGSFLRTGENTELDITNLSMGSSGDIIQVGVPQGRTYVSYAGSNGQNSVFQVDSPVTSVTAYDPSRFQVDVFEDGYTEVSVLEGSLYVQSQNGSTRIDAGTMISMGPDQNAELSPTRPQDTWLSWNLSRDSALASTGPSGRYLSASLRVYGSDFDRYGRWVDNPEYGHVWAPLNVSAGWAPYRVGRWCWVGNDYVWISHEPWGWAPYHYGRWAFLASIGWAWVPPPVTERVYWCPGFVAWVQGPDYVSWVPLAPGEIYYGHGYYGPHSVNIANININRINTSNAYVNSRVTNAVTVIDRDAFLTGRRTSIVKAPANPFIAARTGTAGARFAFGRPDIKPVRATTLPDPVKVVHERILPPRTVQTRAEKVRQREIAVRKDVSVFNRGKRVSEPLPVQKRDRPKPLAEVERHGLPQPLAAQEKAKPGIRKEEANVPAGRRPETQGMARQSDQKPESPVPSREQKQTAPPPQEQRREVTPPSGQRERGAAPQFGEQRNLPQQKPEAGHSAVKPEITRPPVQREARPPVQRPEQEAAPPVQRREQRTTPQEPQREVTPPSGQRERGAAPQFREQRNFSQQKPEAGHSTRGQEMSRPPVRPEATPPAQREAVRPPAQREKMAPPPVRRIEPEGPSTHREMGVAPQFGGQRRSSPEGTPPRKEETRKPQ